MIAVRRLAGGLALALVRGAVRHGASVSMVPMPVLRAGQGDLLEELRVGREARAGIRAIEAFLRQ